MFAAVLGYLVPLFTVYTTISWVSCVFYTVNKEHSFGGVGGESREYPMSGNSNSD